jgi:putative ATP-binding cassette transporter
MTFLQLVRGEMRGSLPKLVLMAGTGGISNAAILAAINTGAQGTSNGDQSGLWAAALFVAALLLFVKTQHYIYVTTTTEIEAIIHRVRLRLMNQIRQSELLAIERIGRSRIVAAIASDTAILAQASRMLSGGIQSVVLIFCVAIYVAYLSFVAFALSVLIIGAAVVIFHAGRPHDLEAGRVAERERALLDRLTDFLSGFKEMRLNTARGADLFDDAVETSRTAANIKIHSQSDTYKRMVSAQSSIYIALGAIVFVAPRFTDSLGGASITKSTMALLFVVGACFGLVQTIPILAAANAAADRISRLDEALQRTVGTAEVAVVESPKRFDRIEMRDVLFRYLDKASETLFQVGPLDFTLRSGDLVFITGGNGSGKSTFLRLLAGLYPPDAGEITLNGRTVNDRTREEYRALISAIFTDYHLFGRLYGIPDPEPAEVERLLAEFRLTDKTGISDREFRTLDLSGGQRKRLALVVSLLEHRPILLLDEWTSDQDPEFRHRFYHELLPALMRTGATVVVVTHDDRYLAELKLPAHRLHMDQGRFVERKTV